MTTTINLKPSQLGMCYDYGVWDFEIEDTLPNVPALQWCKDSGIPVECVVVRSIVVTTHGIADVGLFELEHDENTIKLRFHTEADAVLFKLRWVDF